ncbi:hypothetical protein BIT35_28990 [Klebsiella pneumoniae]|nr:hypothetical protein BIT35_28990 [Klebsiella pneumoniae]
MWSALGVAFFGWAFITSLQAKRGWMRVVQIILLAAALVSVRPLQDWAFGATHTPKSGPWMEQVKTAFGFVILALPVFLLERVDW